MKKVDVVMMIAAMTHNHGDGGFVDAVPSKAPSVVTRLPTNHMHNL